MANSTSDLVEALLAGLRFNHGLSVPEIGRQAGISRIQAYRLVRCDVRRPSFETVTRLQRLEQKLVTRAARPPAGLQRAEWPGVVVTKKG